LLATKKSSLVPFFYSSIKLKDTFGVQNVKTFRVISEGVFFSTIIFDSIYQLSKSVAQLIKKFHIQPKNNKPINNNTL